MSRDKESLYRANILEHYRAPRHWGPMDKPQRAAEESNPLCGDELKVALKFGKDGRVKDVKFDGAGCAISIAAASMLSERVAGRTLDELRHIDRQDVLDDLGIDPGPSRLKCALLGWHVLRKALARAD